MEKMISLFSQSSEVAFFLGTFLYATISAGEWAFARLTGRNAAMDTEFTAEFRSGTLSRPRL